MAAVKTRPTKKAAAKRTPAKKTAAIKTPARRSAAKAAKKAAPRPGPRADLGAPIDGFFAKQPLALRAVLEELRTLIEAAAPEATSSIKWGMPFFTLDGVMMCAFGGHKTHVNLILSGPPDAFDDPNGHLEGTAKIGRHMKLRSVDAIPRADVRRWLGTAAEIARRKK